MIPRVFVFALILLIPVHLIAQQMGNSTNANHDRSIAAQELDAVIKDAAKLNDQAAIVYVKSRAAELVSFSDSIRSENMFIEIWKYVNLIADKDFDKQQARLTILKFLFPRNPKLARQLLAEQTKTKDPSSQSPLSHQDDSQLFAARLASQLLEDDPSDAASLLEKTMTTSSTTASVGALYRLREKDSFLSDYIASKAIEGLRSQPTRASLPGIVLLAAYVFPGPDASIPSTEAENSLELLQFNYFLAASEILRNSINETNEALLKESKYTQTDLQMRAGFQAQVAAIVAALAPRMQPSLSGELSKIAANLSPQIPPQMQELLKSAVTKLSGNTLETEDPEKNFFFYMSKGDFDEAAKQLDRVTEDKKREAYSQLLLKNHAKALLARSDVMGALTLIRKLEDTNRLLMYMEAIKAAKKQRDSDVMSIIINEARLLVPQTDRNGFHVRALFSFISQLSDLGHDDDALELLNNAIVSINALALAKKPDDQSVTKTRAEAALAILNDPNGFLDSPEMERAFSLIGSRDMERGLASAKKIEPIAVQLAARLEMIQTNIRRVSPKPKVAKSASG